MLLGCWLKVVRCSTASEHCFVIIFVCHYLLHVDYRSIIYLCSLVYLIPDARSRANHAKVVSLLDVSIMHMTIQYLHDYTIFTPVITCYM